MHILPVIEPPGFDQAEERPLFAAALEGATAEDLRLMRMRFMEELSQGEIAAELPAAWSGSSLPIWR